MNRFISSIILDSFAGRTRRHDFQPGVTAIIGANGTGKTTIANAVAFVLSGKVPGLPKTNGGIMDALGSTLRMGASVEISQQLTENGKHMANTYDRALIRSGKSIKGEAKRPAPADLLPPVMLDLEPFLAATPKARAGMILGACGDDVQAKLRALLAETGLEAITGKPSPSDDVQEWLSSVDDLVKATASGFTANIKDMRGTLAGMEVLEEGTFAYTGPPLSELRANVSRLEREIASLEGEAKAIASRPSPVQPTGERPNGTAEAFERQLAEAQAKLRQAQADLAQAKADRQAWDRWQAERARLEAKVAEAQKAYQAITDGWEPVDVDKLNEELQSHSMKAAQARAKIDEAKKDVLTDKDVCPCCGAKAEYWNREASDKHDLAAWEREVAASTKRMEEIRATLNQAAAVSRASDAVLRANQAVDFCQPPDHGAAITEADIQGLQDAFDDLAESADMLTAEARKARAWDAYDLAVAEYQKQAADVTRIEEELAAKQPQHLAAILSLQEVEAKHQAIAQAEARQATRKQAEERLASLEADEAAFKAARQAWQDGVNTIMDEALRDVLKVCETFTAGLFVSPLTVHGLELGRYEGAAWVPLDAFCGSDKRVAVAAVQAALASNHKGFKLVILDEFGTIDPARKPAVLANLVAAVKAGLVDQAWIMDNRAIDDMPAEVNEIRLESNT